MPILHGQSPFMRLICTPPLRGLRLPAVGAILCVLCLFPSCKPNDDDDTGVKQCRISHISELSGASFRTDYYFTYDAQNNITSLVSSGQDSIEHKYQYIGADVIIIRTTDSGRFLRNDSLLLDPNRRVINHRKSTNESGTQFVNHSISYNAGGTVQQIIETNSAGGPPLITTYTTTDGNVTASSDGETYGYHPDQVYRDGDYWQIMQLLEDGFVVFKNKNMLANIRKGTTFRNINYTYDANGRTNLLTYNESTNTFQLRFEHFCF